MRFDPKAKLDPSQVENLHLFRNRAAIKRFHAAANKFPYMTMQQRLKILQDWQAMNNYYLKEGDYPIPRPPLLASSIPAWFRPPARRKPNRPRGRA